MKWEERAMIIYGGTDWEHKAVSAGKAMDNQLEGKNVKHHIFGEIVNCPSSRFDMRNWLAWFDPEVTTRRGLGNREIEHMMKKDLPDILDKLKK